MALPFIGVAVSAVTGIAGAIRTFLGWFGNGGAIATFFGHLGIKLTAKSVAVAWQIATIIALTTSRVAFVYAIFEVARLVYNYINHFVTTLPSYLTASDISSLAYSLMRSIGLVDAFMDAFVLFNALYIAIIIAYLAHFSFHTLKIASDEYFKLSVLIQQ